MDMSKIKRKQKKDGMQLEKDVVRKYNQTLGTKQNKKFNTKSRINLDNLDEEYESSIEENNSEVQKLNTKNLFKDSNPKKKTYSELKYQGKSMVGVGKKTEARQTANSGALWHSKGDVVVEHALMEIKHRGTYNARGKSTISIPRDWLIKQKEEAVFEGKDFWYLPFAYKDHDEIYLIKDFDDELQHIQEMRRLFIENEELKSKLEEMEKKYENK